MAEMLEMVVDSIRVSLTTQQRVLILHDPLHDLYLPIWIGSFEAESIIVGLQQIEVSRPQTHDLFQKVILATGSRLKHVEIAKIQDDTFYSNLILENNGEEVQIDCRPSDAISIAIRFQVPIYVNAEVLYTAGIKPEKDLRSEHPTSSESMPKLSNLSDEADELELSVFDSFLKKLDFTDTESSESDSPDELGDSSDAPENPDEPLSPS